MSLRSHHIRALRVLPLLLLLLLLLLLIYLHQYAYREDLDTLNNGVNKLMSNVEEMREKLLAEIAAGRDKTADGAQRLQEVADGLGEALRNCETMSAAISNKAEAKEMAQALTELGSSLEMVAANTFPKKDLTAHLGSKIDKVRRGPIKCFACFITFPFLFQCQFLSLSRMLILTASH